MKEQLVVEFADGSCVIIQPADLTGDGRWLIETHAGDGAVTDASPTRAEIAYLYQQLGELLLRHPE